MLLKISNSIGSVVAARGIKRSVPDRASTLAFRRNSVTQEKFPKFLLTFVVMTLNILGQWSSSHKVEGGWYKWASLKKTFDFKGEGLTKGGYTMPMKKKAAKKAAKKKKK
jgi:hypothetical protein